MPPSSPSLTVLRSYATKSKPETLPSSILFSSNEKTLTIFDAYPKAIFHFLVLPRPSGVSLSVFELANLRSLLKVGRNKAKAVLDILKDEALRVKANIEDEMKNRYGFVWDIWIGFHAVPSME
jgi:aprataxin